MEALNLQQITPVWQQLSHALTPIQTDEQHAAALELLEPIWSEVGENPQHPLGSLLSLMIERIQEYEDRRWPTPQGSPAANLKYLMELRGSSQRELASLTGIDQAVISRLASGERAFTVDHIRRLTRQFRVEPGYFL